MAQMEKVLLLSMLFLLVYGQQGQPQQRLPEEKLLDLVTLSKLLQTAARLAYPITTRINNVVGDLMDSDNFLLLTNRKDQMYENHPARINNRNGNQYRRTSARSDLQKILRKNSQIKNERHLPTLKPVLYDYEYDYDSDYDSDYMEPLVSFEEGDDPEVLPEIAPKVPNTNGVILSNDAPSIKPSNKLIPSVKKTGMKRPTNVANKGPQFKPVSGTKPLQAHPSVNAPSTNANAPGNASPAAKDTQPKIIYVVVSPGDVIPEVMNKDNTMLISNQALLPMDNAASNKP